MVDGHILYANSSFQSAAQCCFVGKFEITSDGDPACQTADLDSKRLKQLVDIICRRVTFDVGIDGKNDLVDSRFRSFGSNSLVRAGLRVGNAFNELADLQFIRSNAIQRGDRSPEDVIHSVELVGSFEGHYICRLFRNADDTVIASW